MAWSAPSTGGRAHILAGEPIITISALQGERIVGYLRQPSY